MLFSFFHINWCSTVCKYLLIVLRMFIHSLILLLKINPIIYYNNPNFPNYSLFSKYFSWFFYLGVHRGTGVLCFFFFTPPLARDSLSRLLRACLRLTEKRWKIAPVLQIQASSMKLRIHGFLFLVFLHIKANGQNKLFLLRHQHLDKEVFLEVSRE